MPSAKAWSATWSPPSVVPYPLHDFSLVNGPSPLPPPPSHFDFAISHFDFAIYHFDFAIYYFDFAVY